MNEKTFTQQSDPKIALVFKGDSENIERLLGYAYSLGAEFRSFKDDDELLCIKLSDGFVPLDPSNHYVEFDSPLYILTAESYADEVRNFAYEVSAAEIPEFIKLSPVGSQSKLFNDFFAEYQNPSYALTNEVIAYLNEKFRAEGEAENTTRVSAFDKYDEVALEIFAVSYGEELTEFVWYKIGASKGSLTDQIRAYINSVLNNDYSPEYKAETQAKLNKLISLLEKHNELTAEEQKYLDKFKAEHPISDHTKQALQDNTYTHLTDGQFERLQSAKPELASYEHCRPSKKGGYILKCSQSELYEVKALIKEPTKPIKPILK